MDSRQKHAGMTFDPPYERIHLSVTDHSESYQICWVADFTDYSG